ncbi:MAG: hypothetical protein CMG75_07945 [Candidatus Marinimicrobia bacterium]|nr:hypothetical protein [Candidatus Neomarinimicrobiota bacterium]
MPDDIANIYDSLPDKVDFNFHVKPILSDRCYQCHGPDDNARAAEFRLDVKEDVFASLKGSDGFAFVKGDLDNSVAWQRIISNDPDFQMPHPESNLSLSTREKALITKWIVQGAEWKDHWAFLSPEEPNIPNDFPSQWEVINPIDNFVFSKLNGQGLSPSEESDKERLIKRVTMDLTGLPPTIEEIEDFLSNDSDDAYDELVERLLETDAYAERMTMEWLDVARYADSHGLHADGWRYMWPWRDWVIKSFKDNMAYDDFVTWQIAGDLFPNATVEQKLATAFQRNHEMTAEGGIVEEEFRQKYVQDRTNTTATAFLGMTMECASCHDHKFDPISQKEYYEMSSFFANVKELGMTGDDGNYGPMLLLPEYKTELLLSELKEKIINIENEIVRRKNKIKDIDFITQVNSDLIKLENPDGFYPFNTIKERTDEYRYRKNSLFGNNVSVRISNPFGMYLDGDSMSRATLGVELIQGKNGNAIRFDDDFDRVELKNIGIFDSYDTFSAGCWINTESNGSYQGIIGNIGGKNDTWRGWVFYLDSSNRLSVQLTNSLPNSYISVSSKIHVSKNIWNHVFFTYDGSLKAGGIKLFINGQQVETTIKNDNLYKSIKPVTRDPENFTPFSHKIWKMADRGVRVGIIGGQIFEEDDDGSFRGILDNINIFHNYVTALEVKTLFNNENGFINNQINDLTKEQLLDHYLHRNDSKYISLKKDLKGFKAQYIDLLENIPEIMVMEDMSTPRKTFVLDRGQYDQPIEEVRPGTPKHILSFDENLPKNRLGLSKWLFDAENPLTARVTVNRYWQMIFGRGIVETPQDFGNQGSLPTHPELLDWLSTHFIKSGWDLRVLIRDMVTSATYRQSSVITEDHASKDPRNIYLARSPSYRLQAEMIRDNALAASGLLNRKIGGASVKPYQPEGLWKEKNEFSSILAIYKPDLGMDLYRRSMYTFIRRTAPHPAMTVFDAPPRSVCVVKREITNTPLQALVLLNDPQFVEAARVLAERIQKEGGDNVKDQTIYAFRLLTGRKPTINEINVLMSQYDTEFSRFAKNPDMALELLGVGESPFDNKLDTTRTAALAMVASTMINHDEAYMKR